MSLLSHLCLHSENAAVMINGRDVQTHNKKTGIVGIFIKHQPCFPTKREQNSSLLMYFHLQVDKVLSVAEDVKNIGNNFFKNQDWKAAVNKYSKALR